MTIDAILCAALADVNYWRSAFSVLDGKFSGQSYNIYTLCGKLNFRPRVSNFCSNYLQRVLRIHAREAKVNNYWFSPANFGFCDFCFIWHFIGLDKFILAE